ncbi:hypothetical protein [Desulfogranum mediterraneum]|uniref:hypothetical protein n=1 Tax=Desulfogranum mediterraneum TaxID=160661 RepID=UPI0003F719F1|nr:hypothetical protein [Desulfogranum mediterraneum]
MKSFRVRIALVVIIALCACSGSGSLLARELVVKVVNDRLTLRADDNPLEQVLLEIEQQSGISIQFILSPADLVSAELDEVPLKEGLGLLLQRYNHAISYEVDAAQVAVITDIFIHSRLSQETTPLHLKLSRSPHRDRSEGAAPASLQGKTGELALYNPNPRDNDPLYSMRGIDPLARYDHDPGHDEPNAGRPAFLPGPQEIAPKGAVFSTYP